MPIQTCISSHKYLEYIRSRTTQVSTWQALINVRHKCFYMTETHSSDLRGEAPSYYTAAVD